MTISQKNHETLSEQIDNVPLSHEKLGQNTEPSGARSKSLAERDPTVFLKAAEEQHQYLREYIRNADQKAIFFFTICSGLLAYLNSKQASQRWIKSISDWSMLDLTAFLAMAGLVIAAICFLWTVVPRLKGSKKGLIFFKSVAEYENGNDYTSDLFQISEINLAYAKFKHCYELAKICQAKYTKLVFGLYVSAVAFVSSLVYLLVT